MAKQRLQKVLAATGFGSRRFCEQLIRDGRVTVNGEKIVALPALVDAGLDRVAVDGKRVRPQRHVYYVLNKPKGILCTHHDPAGRRRAVDLLVGVRERVFPVGRLDADSTGLLLMTNDGALADRLAHPRYGVPRTYRAEVAGCVDASVLEQLRRGVWLAEGKTGPIDARVIHRRRDRTTLEIRLGEGKNREVRRVLARLGHKVRRLKRIQIGPISLRRLPLGGFRPLRRDELAALRRAAVRKKGSG